MLEFALSVLEATVTFLLVLKSFEGSVLKIFTNSSLIFFSSVYLCTFLIVLQGFKFFLVKII